MPTVLWIFKLLIRPLVNQNILQ